MKFRGFLFSLMMVILALAALLVEAREIPAAMAQADPEDPTGILDSSAVFLPLVIGGSGVVGAVGAAAIPAPSG